MRATLLSFFVLLSALLTAQAPALIPYQAIARNAAGEPLVSATLNARFTIHDLTATGTSVWQELQTVNTSPLGLFTVQLGSSVPLASVNWSIGAKFMQVEIDFGSGFVEIGTQQLLSVPFALHAASAPERQQLSVSETGDTLFLENGGFVIMPGISAANSSDGGTTTGTTFHTCGASNVHNPNLTYGSMTDQEGNAYKTITIGTQEWMAENLNTSIYRNGEPITNVSDAIEWQGLITGAWCYYNNDSAYSCPHGKLYNWYTCVDGRQLCPSGWHVPSYAEWNVLTSYLWGLDIAGGRMKTIGDVEQGTGLWSMENEGGNNSSGFSGTPSGGLRSNGAYSVFERFGESGIWWSSSEGNTSSRAYECITFRFAIYAQLPPAYKQDGNSVRCVRD